MDRIFKIFLLWLLALVLPLQGFAVAVKNLCDHAQLHPHHMTAQAAAHQDVMLHDGHHAHAMQAAADRTPDDASPASGKHLGTSCCVTAVMLPSHVSWSPAHQRLAFALAPAASLFSGYIPEGLKRPPRATSV